MANGVSVGREPEVRSFNRFVMTAKPRRVAVSESFLASALQVPALLPKLVSETDVRRSTYRNRWREVGHSSRSWVLRFGSSRILILVSLRD